MTFDEYKDTYFSNEEGANNLWISLQKACDLNVQRNQMTTVDKVRAYSRLYEVYGGDINKVISAIHISKKTVERYIKINNLQFIKIFSK